MTAESPQKSLRDLGLFALFLLALWLCFAAFFGWRLKGWLDRQDWATTEAKIVSVKIEEPPFGSKDECPSGNTAYEHMIVTVTYAFEVRGKRYTSDQFTHNYRGDINCSVPEAEARKAYFERVGALTIHYDPNDPSRSVVRLPDGLALSVGGVGLVLGFGLINGLYWSQRRRLKAKLATP